MRERRNVGAALLCILMGAIAIAIALSSNGGTEDGSAAMRGHELRTVNR